MDVKATFETNNTQETEKLGERLGKMLSKGDFIALKGDLGAGKTAFTRGVAKGLGIIDYVTSPTFTIINEYSGDVSLAHMDVYRLHDPEELEDIGFRDYLKDFVVVMEWADKVVDILPAEVLFVEFEILDEEKRRITFTARGKKYEKIVQELKQ
ncbi:MAG: tRNA (adenosine(37)-N6)-threonylcarbamoyltransferase complex ATPase subunit type 1 TsaE [Thermosediminibacteraceae bacterium]|nr:tRNA (adenosine(37)-N6)-threonylcarbamoyltransferase complex ATPase subunit type 1 TsaE [Thermosediminibacteraceae bacterium]